MKIIIQCAKRKRDHAGRLATPQHKTVRFVARPEEAPHDGTLYVHPDQDSGHGCTWRKHLETYNRKHAAKNPLGLLLAYELYAAPVYQLLVRKFGANKIFILSAGWGLLPAGYLTPDYDITFSSQGAQYIRRRNSDRYKDFNYLPDDGAPVFSWAA